MEKASRKGHFTTISRGYLVFEELFSGFSCFFGEKKKPAGIGAKENLTLHCVFLEQ